MSKDEETSGIIHKNNILTREIRSISYKFDDSLIHNENNYRFKPNFKRASTKLEQHSNKTIDVPREEEKKFYSINDKNSVPEQLQ